jgi:release factor glutamine methyltransferase
MTMSTVGMALSAMRQRLNAAGIEQAGLEARLLLADALACEAAVVIGHPERPLAANEVVRLEERLCRRLQREPLAYILGRREFWSLSFIVDSHTLVPRPETETLVEAALERAAGRRDLRLLDLGTGSGCLLLALLSELPDAWGLGVDIDEGALAVASANAQTLGLDERATFMRADWADALGGSFDLIVTNPPYVSEAEWAQLDRGVRDFEPRLALRAGADGLAAYRRILPALRRLLAPDGVALIETGGVSATLLPLLVREMGLEIVEMRQDLADRRRCLAVSSAAAEPLKNFLGNQVVPV